jgi:hypothetical protein
MWFPYFHCGSFAHGLVFKTTREVSSVRHANTGIFRHTVGSLCTKQLRYRHTQASAARRQPTSLHRISSAQRHIRHRGVITVRQLYSRPGNAVPTRHTLHRPKARTPQNAFRLRYIGGGHGPIYRQIDDHYCMRQLTSMRPNSAHRRNGSNNARAELPTNASRLGRVPYAMDAECLLCCERNARQTNEPGEIRRVRSSGRRMQFNPSPRDDTKTNEDGT